MKQCSIVINYHNHTYHIWMGEKVNIVFQISRGRAPILLYGMKAKKRGFGVNNQLLVYFRQL